MPKHILRFSLFVLLVTGLAACVDSTAPMMACDPNPKCEANPIPNGPSNVKPVVP